MADSWLKTRKPGTTAPQRGSWLQTRQAAAQPGQTPGRYQGYAGTSLLTPQGRAAAADRAKRLFIEDPSLPAADPYGTRQSIIGQWLAHNIVGPGVALGPTLVAKGVGERVIGQAAGEVARRVAPRVAPVAAAARRFLGAPEPVPAPGVLEPAIRDVGRQQALLETAPVAAPTRKLTAWDTAAQIPGMSRALLSSGDLSGWLRQGVFIAPRYPVEFARGIAPSAKALFSEKAFQGLVRDVTERASMPLMQRGGLALSALDNIPLTAREEAYVAVDLVKRIPILRNWIRASERSYSGFLTKLRADVFDSIIRDVEKSGTELTDDMLKAVAGFVNTATGRGDIKGLASSVNALGTVLFSPRLAASRLQLMNPAYYASLPPVLRRRAVESAFAFYGAVATVLSVASVAGARVITDWRRNDFGNIRIGNVRYDITGGFASYMKFIGQMVTGEALSATTGRQITERGKPITRWDIFTRFVEGKFAPGARAVRDILEGESFGQPVTVQSTVVDSFMPIIMQDMFELYQQEGMLGLAMVAPAFVGVGVQTYRGKQNAAWLRRR